ncbi:MAG: hypothetical protein ACYDD4_12520 [Acidimicrobiales bacterium]
MSAFERQTPEPGGQLITTDLIRSAAVSSAELWNDMLQRLAELQATQAELAQAIAEIGVVVREALPGALGTSALAQLPAPSGAELGTGEAPHVRRRLHFSFRSRPAVTHEKRLKKSKGAAAPIDSEASGTSGLDLLPPPPRHTLPPPPALQLAPVVGETEPVVECAAQAPSDLGAAPLFESVATVEPAQTDDAAFGLSTPFSLAHVVTLDDLARTVTPPMSATPESESDDQVLTTPPVPEALVYTPGFATDTPEPAVSVGAETASEVPSVATPFVTPFVEPVLTPASVPPLATHDEVLDPAETQSVPQTPSYLDHFDAEPAPAPRPSTVALASEILASAPIHVPGDSAESRPFVVSEDLTLISKTRKRRLALRLR